MALHIQSAHLGTPCAKNESGLLEKRSIPPFSAPISTQDERVSSITQTQLLSIPPRLKPPITKASLREDFNLDWEDLDQLAKLPMTLEFVQGKGTEPIVLNLWPCKEGYELALKNKDPEFLKQFQTQIDLVVTQAFSTLMGKWKDLPGTPRGVYESALESLGGSLNVLGDKGNKKLMLSMPTVSRADFFSDKQWSVVIGSPSACKIINKKMIEIYRKNLIALLRKPIPLLSEKPPSFISFNEDDLIKLSQSCIGLRHVSSPERAYSEAVKGLVQGSALNISPQFHHSFKSDSSKASLVKFEETLKNEPSKFLELFEKGVLNFISIATSMDLERASIGAEKAVFKKIFEKCRFSLIDFGYDETGRERQMVMTPTDLERYGQGLGQYCRKYCAPGKAFKLVPPVTETDLSWSKDQWKEPIRTPEDVYSMRDLICRLYLRNIILTLRGQAPKKPEGKSY